MGAGVQAMSVSNGKVASASAAKKDSAPARKAAHGGVGKPAPAGDTESLPGAHAALRTTYFKPRKDFPEVPLCVPCSTPCNTPTVIDRCLPC